MEARSNPAAGAALLIAGPPPGVTSRQPSREITHPRETVSASRQSRTLSPEGLHEAFRRLSIKKKERARVCVPLGKSGSQEEREVAPKVPSL